MTGVICAVLAASPVFGASSVDGSLDEIAAQIVERTKSDKTPTIGISTFTHGDGTCSSLSNYVTEFIVDSLFNRSAGQIDIIERSQLSAIFREMELVFDGTIAPDAAKRLGEIEGVDAVVTGSLIHFGEVVKIQARLIGTENGRLFATARSEFPNVGSVAGMMAERSRAQCGFSGIGDDATQAAVQVPAAGNVQTTSLVASSRYFSSDVYDAEVSTLSYSKTTGLISFAVRLKNTSDKPIALSYVPKSMHGSDDAGNKLQYSGNLSGLRSCYSIQRMNLCNSSNPQYATVIPAGKAAQLNYQMLGAKGSDDPKITLGFELVVTPDTGQLEEYTSQSIGFFDMSVGQN
ncbi:MAG: FlgO family outer membrane protein [Pseudomonadota bacterium]